MGVFRCSRPCWNVICKIIIRYKISFLFYLVQTPWRSLCDQMRLVGENKEVDKISCCVLFARVYLKKKGKKKNIFFGNFNFQSWRSRYVKRNYPSCFEHVSLNNSIKVY